MLLRVELSWEARPVKGLGQELEPSQGLEVEPSRVRGLGRDEASQGLEVEPSRARGLGRGRSGRAEPGVEMPGAWTWAWMVCTGNWLEMSGVVVAIGCIVYECLEHGSIFMQLLCLVIDLDVASLYVNFIQVCLWR